MQNLTPSQVGDYEWLPPAPTAWEVFWIKCISGKQDTGMKVKNLSTEEVTLFIAILGFRALSTHL